MLDIGFSNILHRLWRSILSLHPDLYLDFNQRQPLRSYFDIYHFPFLVTCHRNQVPAQYVDIFAF